MSKYVVSVMSVNGKTHEIARSKNNNALAMVLQAKSIKPANLQKSANFLIKGLTDKSKIPSTKTDSYVVNDSKDNKLKMSVAGMLYKVESVIAYSAETDPIKKAEILAGWSAKVEKDSTLARLINGEIPVKGAGRNEPAKAEDL
jgi:hypothetical protein